MLSLARPADRQELTALVAAIDKSQAVIEFGMDGTILAANANFLATMGYDLSEIVGRHHSMFMPPEERDSGAYKAFWATLRRGEYQSGEFLRHDKAGREIWIQASYNPVFDRRGRPVKVVKLASDVTAAKLRAADADGQLSAIRRSQAVIEFRPDGTILDANENFLAALGYRLEEIRGKHHAMFVEPAERESAEYRAFWEGLRRGEFKAGEFKRLGRGGCEVWIQATYNPILDPSGRPYKVVKFASDVTREKLRQAEMAGQLAAIDKSQAVIEFELDGTIISANENFLAVLGYRLEEIRGKHHAMFVEPAERDGEAYRTFWESLRQGAFQAGEFRRVGRGGKEVWIQATYNPILDASGRPFKVVKFASEVTEQVIARLRNEQIRKTMESVAAGAEELNVSVREIAEAMSRSRSASESAFERVSDTGQTTERLAEAAKAMNGIVEAIDGITAKINLLALNASIESARAGEAGKGFAVVANEVKSLAGQAKAATEQIAREIDAMRSVSADVVGGLGSIRESIDAVREHVTASAAAIEQQSGVAGEMSESMRRASAEAAAIG